MIISPSSLDTNLSQLLDEVNTGKTQLPEFQRDWTWDDGRICGIIASLSQGYPMGAIMRLQYGNPEIKFKYRTIKSVGELNVVPDFLVLDGQQRLTSIYQSMFSQQPVSTKTEKGKNNIERYYYLSMEKCMDKYEDRIEAVISVPSDRKIKENFDRDVKLDLSTQDKEYEQKMFPVNIIFDSNALLQWQFGYMTYYSGKSDELELLKNFQNEVINTIVKYKLPVITLDKSTPREAVCKVFENVNTGGVPLTVFELVTATYATQEFDLRKDWKKCRKQIQGIDDTLRTDLLDGIDETTFLTTVTLYPTPLSFIHEIAQLNPIYDDILRKLRTFSICSFSGASGEYVKINTMIGDYILRSSFELSEEIKQIINNKIAVFSQNINNKDYMQYLAFPEFNFYVKEQLKKKETLPTRFLYSTVYVQSIVELYNKAQYIQVINLVKDMKDSGLFENSEKDTQSIIQFYYCSSLARRKSIEFESEVSFFADSDSYLSYNFLKGFNYRIQGKFQFAENSYLKVLERNPKHDKARRELVQLYINMQDYDIAYDLSKQNYNEYPDNIYQMQAYFDCLIHKLPLDSFQLQDAGKGHFSCNQCVGNTGCVTVLTRVFYQSTDRIADKSEHIHENCRSGIQTLLWSSTHKFNSGRCCHSRCNTDLSLTPSDSTGNSGISHGEVTDSARIEENLPICF